MSAIRGEGCCFSAPKSVFDISDGELDEHSQVTNYGHARSAHVTQERILSRLLEMKCCDLAEMFATVSFPLYPRPHEFVDGVMFNWMMPRGERGPRLEEGRPAADRAAPAGGVVVG
jgi:hypothetical protein